MRVPEVLTKIEELIGPHRMSVNVHGVTPEQRMVIADFAADNDLTIDYDDASRWLYVKPSEGSDYDRVCVHYA